MPDFAGIMRASVFDIDDPEHRGRLRLLIPQALGDVPSGWAEPTGDVSPNYFPRVGDRVWCFFEGADVNRPTYISTFTVGKENIAPGTVQDIVDEEVIIIPPDGTPPSGIPTFRTAGMINAIRIEVDPIANRDLVQYEYHVSTNPLQVWVPGDPTTAVHLGPETSFTARALTDGTALAAFTGAPPLPQSYYINVIAKDADGYGSFGAQQAAQTIQITSPDIAANQGWFGYMSVTNLSAGTLGVDVVMGAKLTTRVGDTGPGSEHGLTGSRWWDTAGKLRIEFPSDMSDTKPPYIKGSFEADRFVANKGGTFRGRLEMAKNSVTTLANQQQPPGIAPTAIPYLDPVAITAATWYRKNVISVTDDSANNRWIVWLVDPTGSVLGNPRLEKRAVDKTTKADAAATNFLSFSAGDVVGGVAEGVVGTKTWTVAVYRTSSGQHRMWAYCYATSESYLYTLGNMFDVTALTSPPNVAYSGGSFYVTWYDSANSRLLIRRMTIQDTDGPELLTNTSATTDVSGWTASTGTSLTRDTSVDSYDGASFAIKPSTTGVSDLHVESAKFAHLNGTVYHFKGSIKVKPGNVRTVPGNTMVAFNREWYSATNVDLGATGNLASSLPYTWDLVTTDSYLNGQGKTQVTFGLDISTMATPTTFNQATDTFLFDNLSVKLAAGIQPTSDVWTLTGVTGWTAGTPSWVYKGTALGSDRFIIGPTRQSPGGQIVYVFNPTGSVRDIANEWDAPGGATNAMWWDGTSFWAEVGAQTFNQFVAFTWDATTVTPIWWFASSYTQSILNFETSLGAGASTTLRRRQKVQLTSGPVAYDPSDTNGTDGFEFYAARLLPFAITNKARTGTTATVTTSTTHNLIVGSTVTITGAIGSPFVGTWKVTGVPTGTTFTFTTPTSGTIASVATTGSVIKSVPDRLDYFFQVESALAPGSDVGTYSLSPLLTTLNFTGSLTSPNTATAAPSDPNSAHAWDFPPATPGILASQASDVAGSIINLSGDGSGRAGPWSWDTAGVLVNGPFKLAWGSGTTPTPGALDTVVTQAVSFPAGLFVNAPITTVSTTTTSPATCDISTSTPTNTGFTVRASRRSGALAGIPFQWIAVGT